MRLSKSDSGYQTTTEVVFLSKFNFDLIVKSKLQYDSKRYRLIREPENGYDPYAVAVYVNQLKVGFLSKITAKNVSLEMDSGDVFSVKHIRSSKGSHYEGRFDNDYSDGYYRNLEISLCNESEKARLNGQTIDDEIIDKLKHTVYDHSLRVSKNFDGSKSGGGCVTILVAIIVISVVFLALL